MKKVLLFIACFLLLCGCSKKKSAEETAAEELKGKKSVSGLIPESAEEYLALEQSKMTRSFATPEEEKYANLPPVVDFSTELPSAGVQGEQNSCTGWTTAYAVKSLQEKREQGWKLNEITLFSPAFVYNQINEGKDEGATLKNAMDFLIANGSVPFSLMPYNEKDFLTQPSPALKNMGRGFHSLDKRRIDPTDMNLVKSFLASGEPIILVIELYDNFLNSKPADKGLYKERQGKFLGYHAVVAVGYHDEKDAVKVLNSWGTEWGDGGYGWIDYTLFSEVTKRAYLMYDAPSSRFAVDLIKKSLGIPMQASESTLEGEEEPLMIVPNEAGLFYKGNWLRLGEEMKKQDSFFSAKTSPRFADYQYNTDNLRMDADDVVVLFDALRRNNIGRFIVRDQKRVPVYTNRGITFGSPKEDVRRIYGKPDAENRQQTFVHGNTQNDIYFFHPIKSDWGGVQLDQHAMLQFNYNADRRVNNMELAVVFKQMVKKGGFFVDFLPGEKKPEESGTRITSKAGGIEILIPKMFTDIQKADWGEAGMGIFAKKDPCSLSAKVFYMKEKVNSAAIQKRMDADILSHQLTKESVAEKTFGRGFFGTTKWMYVEKSDGERVHYYTGSGSKLYQVEAICETMPWMEEVMQSIEID